MPQDKVTLNLVDDAGTSKPTEMSKREAVLLVIYNMAATAKAAGTEPKVMTGPALLEEGLKQLDAYLAQSQQT